MTSDDPYAGDHDHLWQVFADATLRIAVGDTDLVVGVDPMPWSGVAHAVTAWNPGESRSRRDNDAANDRLAAELRAAGVRHHPAVGASPDGSWEEPGFVLVGLHRDEAVEWGRRYGQLAIYEIADGRLVVIST